MKLSGRQNKLKCYNFAANFKSADDGSSRGKGADACTKRAASRRGVAWSPQSGNFNAFHSRLNVHQFNN